MVRLLKPDGVNPTLCCQLVYSKEVKKVRKEDHQLNWNSLIFSRVFNLWEQWSGSTVQFIFEKGFCSVSDCFILATVILCFQ